MKVSLGAEFKTFKLPLSNEKQLYIFYMRLFARLYDHTLIHTTGVYHVMGSIMCMCIVQLITIEYLHQVLCYYVQCIIY